MSRRRRPWPPVEASPPWIYKIHDPSLPLGHFSDERLPGGDNRGSIRRINTGRFWTKEEILQAFDALPKAVREALASANHPWAPHWAEFSLHWELFSDAAIVARIEKADREEAMRRELQLLAGQG